jgi:hypothetical protein
VTGSSNITHWERAFIKTRKNHASAPKETAAPATGPPGKERRSNKKIPAIIRP